MPVSYTVTALDHFPLVAAGDDLWSLLQAALSANAMDLEDGDILVLAQKIISKAEGRMVTLADVRPGKEAAELAEEVKKDPRLVQLILDESNEVVKLKPGVLLVEQKLGIVMANAGIDASNVSEEEPDETVLLLPVDPDGSCEKLRQRILQETGLAVAVIISDSVGRAWRLGTTGLAIGVAGLPSLQDLRGEKDLFGRELRVSEEALADELAGAASLVQGQGAEGRPVVLIRGLGFSGPSRPARDLLRARQEDMFR